MTTEVLEMDQMVAETIRCQRSFTHFLTHVYVRDATKGAIRMELWPYLMEVARDWESGISCIEGKGRQLGYSWLLAAYDNWVLRTRENGRILSISIGERESKQLLDKVKFIEEHLPEWMQLKRSHDNKTEFGFASTGSSMIALP